MRLIIKLYLNNFGFPKYKCGVVFLERTYHLLGRSIFLPTLHTASQSCERPRPGFHCSNISVPSFWFKKMNTLVQTFYIVKHIYKIKYVFMFSQLYDAVHVIRGC